MWDFRLLLKLEWEQLGKTSVFFAAVTELVQWFNLIEQIHLLQMAELKLLEIIWADSIEIEKILEFYSG
jgi:hypothetical protein